MAVAAIVNDSGAWKHNKELIDLINSTIEEALPNLAKQLQDSVVSRTPTVDEEYKILMVGEGGDTPLQVPRSGDSSDDAAGDEDTNRRVRLHKDVETYLWNINSSPNNVEFDILSKGTFSLGIGNTELLAYGSHYTYTNANGTTREKGGPDGYFMAFESGRAGAEAYVEPRYGRNRKGRFYPLRPGYVKLDKRQQDPDAAKKIMYKPVPAFNMYNLLPLDWITHSFMAELLESIGPGNTSF